MVQAENARIVEMYKTAGQDDTIDSIDSSLEKDLVG